MDSIIKKRYRCAIRGFLAHCVNHDSTVSRIIRDHPGPILPPLLRRKGTRAEERKSRSLEVQMSRRRHSRFPLPGVPPVQLNAGTDRITTPPIAEQSPSAKFKHLQK